MIASTILAALKTIAALLQIAQEKRWIKAGEDRVIAEAAVSVLNKTETAKQVLSDVMKMSDSQVDEALKQLEP